MLKVNKTFAFTLAEVLIALVIIGVISAITVPSILATTQEKEFHSKFKKNVSVLENALRRAQVEEGLMGDNTAIFEPSEDSNRSYKSALKFSQYVNAVKICANSSSDGCKSLYDYKTSFAQSGYLADKDAMSADMHGARILLQDGSLWQITQNAACDWVAQGCLQNEDGTCKYDENGNMLTYDNPRTDCAELALDVNGQAGPNRYGKDIFNFSVRRDRVKHVQWAPRGGTKATDIITGKV